MSCLFKIEFLFRFGKSILKETINFETKRQNHFHSKQETSFEKTLRLGAAGLRQKAEVKKAETKAKAKANVFPLGPRPQGS